MPFRKVTTFIVAWYCIKITLPCTQWHPDWHWLIIPLFIHIANQYTMPYLPKMKNVLKSFRHGIIKIFGLVWLVGGNMFQDQKQDCPQKRWSEWALWHYHMQDILAIYFSFLPLSSRSLELLSLDLISKVRPNSYQIHVQHLESTPDILAT